MSILENAVRAIQVGVEDSQSDEVARIASAVRNVYAGVLLLFKERLRRLSPEGSNEVLVRGRVEPRIVDERLTFVGVGRNTIELHKIRDWFAALQISVDWPRLQQIRRVRNEIEHYYTTQTKEAVIATLAAAQVLIRDFVTEELDEDPLGLLGENCWSALLENEEVYRQEREKCAVALQALPFGNDEQESMLEEAECLDCGSVLIAPADEPYSDHWGVELLCRACGEQKPLQEFVETGIRQRYDHFDPRAARKGDDRRYVLSCPECNCEAYVEELDRCLWCNYERCYESCIGCECGLSLEEQDLGGLCSYCHHVATKD